MTDSSNKPNYILSDSKAQKEYVEVRGAETWIPFFIPHLQKGMSVLDCGCGVGSITLDIAELVYPGEVIGIDIDPIQLCIAKTNAKNRKIPNVSFIEASVFSLPYETESFDAILAHTLLIHLPDQIRALKEFHRLLKPGGIVAVSDDDWGTFVQSPESSLTKKSLELMTNYIRHNGGDPYYSRHLRSYMSQAGFFKNIGLAHAPEYYGKLEETKRIISVVNGILSDKKFRSTVIKNNWASEEEINAIMDANIQWSNDPNAFATHIYCAALGWKDK